MNLHARKSVSCVLMIFLTPWLVYVMQNKFSNLHKQTSRLALNADKPASDLKEESLVRWCDLESWPVTSERRVIDIVNHTLFGSLNRA